MIVDVRPNNPPPPGRPRKRSRRSGGSGTPKKRGCPIILLAWAVIIPLVGYAAWSFVVGAGQLVGLGLAAVIGP